MGYGKKKKASGSVNSYRGGGMYMPAYKCGGTHKYGNGGAVNFSKAMKQCRKKRRG